MIDRELRARGLLFRTVNPAFTTARLRVMSRLMRVLRPTVSRDGMHAEEQWITRKDGGALRLLIFRPLAAHREVPGILWFHGGGYAMGVPEQVHVKARRFIEWSSCVVVAPGYRLSVDAPYPAALEDAYEALQWMRDNAGRLGIRNDQLMVGGDSAGGGLAAALTLYARDQGGPAIAFQMPLYPMLDDRMNTESARDNNAPVWNSRSNRNAWKLYLGERLGTEDVPQYAAPARALRYEGLPPAATFVGDLEVFRDETVTYVEGLRNAGVEVAFRIFPGCYHGFDTVCPDAGVTRQAVEFLKESYLRAVTYFFAGQKTGG